MNKKTQERLVRVRQLRKDAARAQTTAMTTTRKVCKALSREGYSTRAIGEMLGISGVAVFKIQQG